MRGQMERAQTAVAEVPAVEEMKDVSAEEVKVAEDAPQDASSPSHRRNRPRLTPSNMPHQRRDQATLVRNYSIILRSISRHLD
jgi:hypothetical protein